MKISLFLILLFSCFFFGFLQMEKPETSDPYTLFGALPEKGPIPASDSLKIELGRLLFWDPILSGNREVSCASCHTPAFGYTDNLDVSIGVGGIGKGYNRRVADTTALPHYAKRNAQTILNVVFNGMDSTGHYDPDNAPMFWDSRASSLEEQILGPLTNADEMRGNNYPETVAMDCVVNRLKAIQEYTLLFSEAFQQENAVSASNIAKAIATFEGTIISNNSPFDKFMRGDKSALTPLQITGMKMFINNGCANCHNGPMFSDYELHVLSVPENPKLDSTDTGADGTFAFRTPSLRNLYYTWPYFHSGTFDYLEDAIDFYRTLNNGLTGTRKVQLSQVDPLARKVTRGSITEITAFLMSLNDPTFDREVPERLPSQLPVGGNME